MSLPTVAIVGRPNVGKSSLFNRFIRRRLAVVAEQSGVTRDRNYTVADWNGVDFRLVDTGGIVPASDDMMEKLIYDQAEFAITEADLILMVVDTQVGVDPVDRQIARRLNRSGSRCLLVANKADNEIIEQQIYEFMKLGLGEPIASSATSGHGIGDLLDAVVANLPKPEGGEGEDEAIRVALVGRPNVGKSSFINRLIGQDRLIVSPVAGTTRDAVDTPFEFEGKKYILVDTAGLRRKYKVYENIEFYTNIRAARAIDDADVAVILIDAVDGLTSQDQHIFEMVHKMRRAALLAVNKWDLIEKDTHTADRYTEQIKGILARYSNLPVIYVSALSGKRVAKVLELVHSVHEENHKRIATSELNRFLKEVTERQHPPAREGKYIKFMYLTQSEVSPPTFIFFVNVPKLVDRSYISYLTNQLRSHYGFEGVPIRLKFRRK